jgi:glycosyltransferase involved in cell wall biosynthesis
VPVKGIENPLRIAYLLEDTPLFGGVKVVLQQAGLMASRGHQVTVVSPGEPPSWFPLMAEFRQTAGLGPADIPDADVLVASYWTTIRRALDANRGEVVHYCQGFEGSYTHNSAEHAEIERAYGAEVPAMVVAPHLGKLLAERFGRPSRVVAQPLESSWRSSLRWRPRRPPRVLVTSPFEIDWKGVSTALEAVLGLRRRGMKCQLVRLSQWPLSEAERAVVEPDEFHEYMLPQQVPSLFRSCDLLLAASWEQEGFGLPVLEAMACGVPTVVSDIRCFRDWAASAAQLVPSDDPEAFAVAALEILDDPATWRRIRRSGRRVASQFKQERSACEAEEALRWVASGAWRQEIGPP